MKQKETFGITLFGVIFILIGVILFNVAIENAKLYFPTNKLLAYTYTITSSEIQKLQDYVNNNVSDKSLALKFKIEKLKLQSYLETFKRRYLIQKVFPLSTLFYVIFNFITSILYLAAGFFILRLYRFTYRLMFWSIFFGFCLFFLLFCNSYEILKQMIILTQKTVNLSNIVSQKLEGIQFELPLKIILKSKQTFIVFLLLTFYVFFSIFVSCFFNKKTIKKQFNEISKNA
ncbi:MAG: hypothetical protein NC935_01765 [Candidatus Omnitrophica bacterium]|nr:hypothetical protein [Candidatus Omnitrophota bacterium]